MGEGDIFVALSGDRFDGHDFLERRRRRVARPPSSCQSPSVHRDSAFPRSVVPDTLTALGDLARYRRRAWGKPVVAIAGSNGKTTTKELVRGALGAVFSVHATSGNYNNRIGVPLTLLGIPDAADMAVIEVGTNAHGEVALLRAITEPECGRRDLHRRGAPGGIRRLSRVCWPRRPRCSLPPPGDRAGERCGTGRGGPGRARRRVVAAGLGEGDLRASSWEPGADGAGQMVVDGVPVQVPLRGIA